MFVRFNGPSEVYFQNINELEAIELLTQWRFNLPGDVSLPQNEWAVLPQLEFFVSKLTVINMYLQ